MSKTSRRGAGQSRLLLLLEFALVCSLLLQAVIGTVIVQGPSMLPSLHDGEPMLYVKLPALIGDIKTGDLVLVAMPDGSRIVKRVHRVGGETVEPIFTPIGYGSRNSGPYIVPAGSVYLLGDNPDESLDSRAFGCVSTNQIIGRVLTY